MAVAYRRIEEGDLADLKALHEHLFPVKYSDSFFRDIVAGRAVRGGLRLFSSLAIQSINGKEEIVGFILAQTMLTSSCDDIDGLFESGEEPSQICYILTLGLRRDQRRTGIGSILVQQCVEFSSQIPECGAVYLHVISYNLPGRRFYEKNSFLHAKHNSDFYTINGRRYSSETFAKYLNGFHPPLTLRFYEFISSQSLYLFDTLRWIEQRIFGSSDLVSWLWLTSSSRTEAEGVGKEEYPYMDDIILPPPEPSVMEPPPYPPPIHAGSENI